MRSFVFLFGHLVLLFACIHAKAYFTPKSTRKYYWHEIPLLSGLRAWLRGVYYRFERRGDATHLFVKDSDLGQLLSFNIGYLGIATRIAYWNQQKRALIFRSLKRFH